MGFLLGCHLPLFLRLLLVTVTRLFYFEESISILFLYLGLPGFLKPDTPRRNTAESADVSIRHHGDIPLSALLFRELLPVVKFSDLVDPPDHSCAVCCYDLENEDEIRRLTNCRHVFHRSCLDRWMGYDRRTCPLCRKSFVPDDDMEETFNERLWAASGIYGDYS